MAEENRRARLIAAIRRILDQEASVSGEQKFINRQRTRLERRQMRLDQKRARIQRRKVDFMASHRLGESDIRRLLAVRPRFR
jgi:hypothetical protein